MNRVVFVHGYDYWLVEPEKESAKALYQSWAGHLHGFDYWPFMWQSAAFPWQAWWRGYWNTYRYAYRELAVDASHRLQRVLDDKGEWNILCHSLGSRVALLALHGQAHRNVKRVLILNGAEARSRARVTAEARPEIEFFNVVVKADPILSKLAANFTPGGDIRAIGHAGMGEGLPNVHDIELKDSRGHEDSYRDAKRWPVWREILDGAGVSG